MCPSKLALSYEQAEERTMLERSLNQILLGNYSDDVTLLGTLGQFLLGMTGADVLMDARDLTYDLTHLNEVPAWQVLVDAVGLIPVVGALKNVDEVAALVKAFRQGENLLGNLGDSARAGSRLALAGAGAAENAGTLNRVSESFDAAADTARGGQRLAETGEVVADTAKATERAVDSADEVIDTSLSGVYNGQKGTNQEVREWYVHHALSISDSIDQSLSLEEQAKQACELRNILRTSARDLMSDSGMRAHLDQTRPNPTFEELLAKKWEEV